MFEVLFPTRQSSAFPLTNVNGVPAFLSTELCCALASSTHIMENPIDIDKIKETLEPDNSGGGGLQLPGKDRVVFRPPERKSLLGLDALAIAKRAEGSFKVPRERVSSMMASIDEDMDKTTPSLTGLDDVESGVSSSGRNYTSRKYRDSSGSKTFDSESQITEEGRQGSTSSARYEDVTPSSRSSRSNQHRSSRYDP